MHISKYRLFLVGACCSDLLPFYYGECVICCLRPFISVDPTPPPALVPAPVFSFGRPAVHPCPARGGGQHQGIADRELRPGLDHLAVRGAACAR